MKKITILFITLLCWSVGMRAQCTNTTPFPPELIIADNSGDPQQINSCVYTGNFSTLSNLIIGHDYTFSLNSNGVAVTKYITVTDLSNNILAHGVSPLTVVGIPNATARVHYSEDANCGAVELCLEAYVTATLTCPFPTGVQITGVTQTHASFAWTPGGTEAAWQVSVLPKGSPSPDASVSGIPVGNTPSYAVDNLEAGHRYQFYVRAACSAENSPWRGPFDFNAACSPVTELNENFDGVTDNELPACWTALKVNTGTDTFIGIDALSHSAPNAVQLANGNSGPAAKIMVISPDLSTVGSGDHRLKFYTRGYGPVTIEVGTVNTTTSDGTFHLIETINANANYTEHIVNFMSYVGSDTHIAFRHANTSNYNPVFIDDIKWEPVPLCPDLGDIEMTAIAQTSASLAWEAGGSETQWDVVYSDTSNDPTALTPISPAPTSAMATITGLQPDTTYKVWVRSSCGGTAGNGAWMNPVVFTTACNAVNTLNETFESVDYGMLPDCWSAIIAGEGMFNSKVGVVTSNAATGSNAVSLFDGDGVNGSKIILVSPSLNTVATGTHRVKFYAKSNVPATLSVGTLDSAASGGVFSEFQTISLTANYAEYVVDFNGYSGTNQYIGFKHASGQFVNIYLDDIRWEQTPLCADVTGITVDNATAESVSLHWNANSGEAQWDVVYGPASATDPTTLVPISPAPTENAEAVLSGLTPNTPYKAWVRSVCGGTQGNGAWIGPIPFRTACSPTSNFVEGFEDAELGALPDCWSAVLAGPTIGQYAAVRTVNSDMAFGNNAVEINANSSAPTDKVILVSPYLDNLGAGTHRLKFYALSYDSATPFEIGTMDGNTSQANYTTFQALTLGSGYNEYVIDFTGYTGTDTFIAFRNVAGNYNSTFVDNVRWEVLPSCPDVTNLAIGGISANGASVSWQGDLDAGWQVAYGPSSVTDPATLTPSGVITEMPYQLSGLEGNTSYHVWVRSVCSGADLGAWIGPVVFRTDCMPTSVPYAENFESVNFPNIPECFTAQTISGNSWDTTFGDSGYGFDGLVIRYYSNASDADSWFFTQGLQLTAGTTYMISYKYGNNSTGDYTEQLQVSYGTSPNAQSMLNEIADHTQINSGMAATNSATFLPPATGDYYFGFHAHSAANQSQLFVDNISIDPMLSVPGEDKGNLNWYPNPVRDLLYLSCKGDISDITILNLLGQKVLGSTPNLPSSVLDLSALPTGNYIMKVNAEGTVRTIKLLKQ